MKLRLSIALIALSPFCAATTAFALPDKQIPIDYSVFDKAPPTDIPGASVPGGVFDSPYNVDDLSLGSPPDLNLPPGGFESNPLDGSVPSAPGDPGSFELDPLLKKDKNGELTKIYEVYNQAAPILEALGGFINKNLGFNVLPWLDYGDFIIGREKQGTLESQSEVTVAGVPVGDLQGPNGEVDPALVEAQAIEEFKTIQKGEPSLLDIPSDVIKKNLVGLSLTRANLKKQQVVLGKFGQQFAKESLEMVNQLVKNSGDLSAEVEGQKSTQDVNKGLGKMMANSTLIDRAIYVESQQNRLASEQENDTSLKLLEKEEQKEWGEQMDSTFEDASIIQSSAFAIGLARRQDPSKTQPPVTVAQQAPTTNIQTRNPFLQ